MIRFDNGWTVKVNFPEEGKQEASRLDSEEFWRIDASYAANGFPLWINGQAVRGINEHLVSEDIGSLLDDIVDQTPINCPECNSTGEIHTRSRTLQCPKCNGTGHKERRFTFKVTVRTDTAQHAVQALDEVIGYGEAVSSDLEILSETF